MQNDSAMPPPGTAEYHAHVYFDPDTRPLAA